MNGISRRSFLKGTAAVAGAAMVGGCSSNTAQRTRTSSPGGPPGAVKGPTVKTLTWTLLGVPLPFGYTGGPGYWRMTLLFDTLLWRDHSGKDRPWLASSYKASEDGLVHTLDLRDVKWDDGRPVTARDVAFTYEYYTSHIFTPLVIAVPPKGIDVRPTGERTVEFRLQHPDATFVQRVLSTMPVAPEHVWARIGDPMSVQTSQKGVLTATGPYVLAERSEDQDRELYLAKPNYFLGRPYVPRIEMVEPPGDNLSALKAGIFNAVNTNVEGVTNPELAPFRGPEWGMITRDGAWGFPLFFNLKRGGALADVRFRRACIHAIDRNDMITRILTGNGQPGSAGWLSPANAYYEPDVRSYPFDRTEAERLLDEGGYRRSGAGGKRTNPDGSPLHYTVIIPDTVPIPLAELTARSLQEVGLDISLQRIDLVRTFGSKLQAAYDLMITSYPGPAGIGPDGDPDLLRSSFHSKYEAPLQKANGYANPDVDRMLDEQLATVDVDARKKVVSQIQKQVAEDVPAMMLYYTKLYFIFRKDGFDQWYFTPGGFGPGIPDVYNKHPYITGRQEGLEIRPA